MSANLDELAAQATRAAQAGRFEEAARLWGAVREAAPEHPDALFGLGMEALRLGDVDGARDLLRRAATAAPKRPMLHLSLAAVERRRGDTGAELAALDDALAAEPLFLPALLAKGACLERMDKSREAAWHYRNALKIAPPDDRLPAELRTQAAHAREIVAADAEAARAFIAARVGEMSPRMAQSFDVLTGKSRVYVQEPSKLHVPGLPAIQFYDTKDFAWVEGFEAHTADIRAELEALLAAQAAGDLTPYIAYPRHMPANQFAELNHSPRWSAFHFYRNGVRQEDNCARCPRTAAAIETLPLPRWPGHAPNVMFSVLSPGTRIPPHSGETNARLVAHLPLVVPEGCGFRVGSETRGWMPGKVLIFDDSIEHEAWNESDQTRVVLIFDLWNPHLAEAERELAITGLAAMNAYYHETL